MALHIRLGFGYWPDQAIDHYPALLFRVHVWLFVAANLFAVFAAIQLLFTLIQHRRLGVHWRQVVVQGLAYVGGWVALFVVTANVPARFVTWLLD